MALDGLYQCGAPGAVEYYNQAPIVPVAALWPHSAYSRLMALFCL